MKKQFRNKKCVYCGKNYATTDDHVFARGFFCPIDRDNNPLPKVPACAECNNTKSHLDEYVMSVLAFGGKHASALENIKTAGLKRIQNNLVWKKQLRNSSKRIWVQDATGLIVPTTTFQVDPTHLVAFFQYVAKGLLWYHWETYLPQEADIYVMFHTEEEDKYFRERFDPATEQFVINRLRNNTIQYQGSHAGEKSPFSAWRIMMYGGVCITSSKNPYQAPKTMVGIVTGDRCALKCDPKSQ